MILIIKLLYYICTIIPLTYGRKEMLPNEIEPDYEMMLFFFLNTLYYLNVLTYFLNVNN